MLDVLPDSRLQTPRGTQFVDWALPDGSTVRCEVETIFCANCGKLYGYVPRENTAFVFWLCRACYERYGAIAGLLAVPDEEFRQAVHYEMQARFGRDLTELEIATLAEQGQLGRALELLEKESPYPVY